MTDTIKKQATERMEKSLASFQSDLSKLRTGRAHPSLVEHIMVPYYGNNTPLNQVSNVSVEDARTLLVSPWEKALIPTIEKAIMTADLGLNPVTHGNALRIPLPPLTEERRKEMVKLLRNEAENARVAMRSIRRDANTQIKDLLKAKEITEDDVRRTEETIQKLTDGFIAKIEVLLKEKETDILEI